MEVMVNFRKLSVPYTSREILGTFRGYNAGSRISDGEWGWTQNMTVDEFPAAANRARRGIVRSLNWAKGMTLFRTNQAGTESVALMYIAQDPTDGNNLRAFVNGAPLDEQGDHVFSSAEQIIVPMGGKIYFFPDAVSWSTVDGSWESLNAEYKSGVSTVKYIHCDENGVPIAVEVSSSEPQTHDGYWFDITDDQTFVKQWSESAGRWEAVLVGPFIRIQASGIGEQFEVGNALKISGCSYTAGAGATEAQTRSAAAVAAINSEPNITSLISAKSDDFIVVPGILCENVTQDAGAEVKLERKAPAMDYVIAGENRLWGCRFDGNLNEIYASKLGDPSNWRVYAGLSTDSYAMSVGQEGDFTGALFCGGYPLFFKENCILKIHGSQPSNYQLVTINGRGVKNGSSKSLCNVNEVAIYQSVAGVCMYDGAGITDIGEALGTGKYSDGVAAAGGGKYYLSTKEQHGEWHFFCYDVSRGTWMREDGTHAVYGSGRGDLVVFMTSDGDIFMTDDSSDAVFTDTHTAEGNFYWEAITGIIGFDQPDNKYITRFNIRAQMQTGSVMDMYIEYDSDGVWHHEGTMQARTLRSFTLPVRPCRCDHLRLKFVGKGDAKIFSITKILEEGSDEV